jgi:Zn-dependent oligopeptidase
MSPFFSIAPFTESFETKKIQFFDALKTAQNTVKSISPQGTFQKTLLPLLKDIHTLQSIFTRYDHENSVMSTDESRKTLESFLPEYVAFFNDLLLDTNLYQTLLFLEKFEQEKEETAVIQKIKKDMEHAGVHLSPEKQKQVKEINEKLSLLSEKFAQNVQDAKKEFSYHLKDESLFPRMKASDKIQAKKRASEKNGEGFVFTLDAPSSQAILQYCDDSTIRKHFYDALQKLGSHDPYDNRKLAQEMIILRQKKAKIFGKQTHTEYVLETRMAKREEEIENIILPLTKKVKEKAEKELQMLKKAFSLEEMNEWDIAYFLEKYRDEFLSLKESDIDPYFEYTSVLSGMFDIANKLFSLEMKERTDIPLYHEEARLFEVLKDNHCIGYYLIDLFTRAEKNQGAWCNDLSKRFQNTLPLMCNIGNFGQGDPCFLSHREVETLFHEFGHALHVILSKNTYSETSGFEVEWDFVELPSQIMENWVREKESVQSFALHFYTKKVFPEDFIEKLKTTKTLFSGLSLLRQCLYTLGDLALHSNNCDTSSPENLQKFWQDTLQKHALFPIQTYNASFASFTHIFAGGYSSGYYSYLWAEILEAQVFAEFKKNGVFHTETAQKYLETILSPGSVSPAYDLFFNFTQKPVDLEYFYEKYGIGGVNYEL